MTLGQGQERTLTLNTHIPSSSCLHLPNIRSQAAIVSEKSIVFTFPTEKPVMKFYLVVKWVKVNPWPGSSFKNNDGPESPMLHTNFRGNRSTGSVEEEF